MSISNDEASLLEHMPKVRSYHKTLCDLGVWWQKVALIGKINSLQIAATLLEDMESTRRKFETLQNQLIESLIKENLYKQNQELGARAQVAIDILIRNLFERTADVGFLATDDDLRAFLSQDEKDSTSTKSIVERLCEYTLKYSVYDEIIVLDKEGRVQVHLDEIGNPISQSYDPLIQQTLTTKEPFVETFRHSDLQPGKRHSLIYSARITESDDAYSKVLGVLCLCFRFDNEMAGIFEQLQQGNELISILDSSGRVIASSDEKVVACGSKIKPIKNDKMETIQHDELACLARTANTKGYQEFYGLSWKGHVMIPIKAAFSDQSKFDIGDQELPETSHFFSQEIHNISSTATLVTEDLILIVLNGQIVAAKRDANEFMPVLDEIRQIGKRTKGVFEESIANLYGTVISSLLSDVQFQAFLSVDIMDRNLYERANDVRWWALTTQFREILEKSDIDVNDREMLSMKLAYINELYTVYTNLFLYGENGEILAVSNVNDASLVGTRLPMNGHFKDALNISDSQSYIVSPFEATSLYNDRHTYIYITAVRSLSGNGSVGGIGIVFDSEPQFSAMLEDALPRGNDGNILDGCFGVFADRSGQVISSTNQEIRVGDTLKLDQRYLNLENGERFSSLLTFNDRQYALGAAMSQGYREYKTSGDYINDIVGLIFVPV